MEAFAVRTGLDVRRPEALESARLQPSADLGALVLADAVVRDEVGSVRWGDLDEGLREAWLKSMATRDAELAGARDLALASLAARPGWGMSASLAGQLEFLLQRRDRRTAPKPERWATPLAAAMARAPGSDLPAESLGVAYLETWPSLGEERRRAARPVIRRASLDPKFVTSSLPLAVAALGTEEAARLVPSEPLPLRTARDWFARGGDLPTAAALHSRWRDAERVARKKDLEAIELRNRRGDAESVRRLCRAWVSVHPPRDFADRNGVAECARVLALWPAEGAGTWRSDPRAELVKFFLEGREEAADGAALARAASGISGVPDPVKARTALLAGDRYAWETVLRGSETVGAFEWTGFFAALAREEVKAGRLEEARDALAQIAEAAQGECDVLLARREVERARGKGTEGSPALAACEAGIEAARLRPAAFSSAGLLALCIDPEKDGAGVLRVRLAPTAPVLLEWGFDGGTVGSDLVSSARVLEVPLAGLSGRRTFRLASIGGPRPVVTGVSVGAGL